MAKTGRWLFVGILSTVVQAGLSCSDDDGCSLNGICKQGSCECDIPWRGATCDMLDVLETVPGAGYNQTAQETSSWGGSVVQDDDGSWHMFVSEMFGNCGLGAWSTNSQIVHAISENPLGPYRRSEVVVPIFAHNPTVRRINGTWVMYHIGLGDGQTVPRSDCSGGMTPSGSGPDAHGNPHYTMFRTARSLHGPWTPGAEVSIQHPESFPGKQWTTNPAPWVAGKDIWFPYRNPGSYWSGGSGSERLGMARGQSFQGPFEDLTPEAPIAPYALEDPFLWVDGRGHFHMITHKKDKSVPAPDQDSSLGHLFSRDGVKWSASANSPVPYTFALSDGSSVHVKKMARPQVVVTEGRPTYISIGCTADGAGDHTTTVVLPLRSASGAAIAV